MLGRYITDHIGGGGASATVPGLDDRYYEGRTPSRFYIPRFRNVSEPGKGYVRGGAYQNYSYREDVMTRAAQPGFGADYKHAGRTPGRWRVVLAGFGEMLPRWENRMSLHASKTDKWGLPQVHFDVSISDNERNMSSQSADDAVEMLRAAGAEDIKRIDWVSTPGTRVHEMGGAVMGDDPTASVTNRHNQLHIAPNVFVTDGASFPSGGCQNPSLSYMAITARAADYAATLMQEGVL